MSSIDQRKQNSQFESTQSLNFFSIYGIVNLQKREPYFQENTEQTEKSRKEPKNRNFFPPLLKDINSSVPQKKQKPKRSILILGTLFSLTEKLKKPKILWGKVFFDHFSKICFRKNLQ